MSNKITLVGDKCRQAIKKGVDFACDAVKRTLGPSGRNVIMNKMDALWHEISDDGVTLLKELKAQNEIEDLAVKAVANVCSSTNDRVGDGTTTSAVLAQAIFNAGYEKTSPIVGGIVLGKIENPVAIRQEIMTEMEKVVAEIEKSTKPVTTNEDIWNIAYVSSNSKQIADIISEAYKKITKDGKLLIEESLLEQTECLTVEGVEIPQGYIHNFLANKKNEAIFEEQEMPVKILFTNKIIDNPGQLVPICEQLAKKGINRLVLFARAFQYAVYPTIIENRLKGVFHILAVTFPTADEVMEDYAILTGGKFVNEYHQMKMEDVKIEDLGEAEKVTVKREKSYIIKPKGDKEAIKQRLERLKADLKEEKVKLIKEKIEKRLGALGGGLGVIKVGSSSESAKTHLKKKIEDAVNATKIAIEQGVVKGAGLALKEIVEKLPKSILTEPLKEPYYVIQQNAGGDLKIEDNVIDPAGVVKTALRNACEVAGHLLCVDVAVADEWQKPCSCNSVENAVTYAERKTKEVGENERMVEKMRAASSGY